MLDPKRKLYRWGPISGCPLFMYYTIETSFEKMKDLLGVCYSESLIIFKDKKVTWLLDEEGIGQASSDFVERNISNDVNNINFFELWNQRDERLKDEFDKLRQPDRKSLSDEALEKLFNEFSEVYLDWWTVTMAVELVTATIEPALGKALKQYFLDEHPKDLNRAFAILSSPRELTFYRKEQQDLLRIADLPEDQKKTALEEHQRKFYWIYNSYLEGTILGVDYFEEELNKLLEGDYQQILDEIDNYSREIERQKNEILEKIKPSQEVRNLINLVETFSALQDDRKATNFKADGF